MRKHFVLSYAKLCAGIEETLQEIEDRVMEKQKEVSELRNYMVPCTESLCSLL